MASTVPMSHSRGAGCEARVLLPCNLSSELNVILIFPAYHVPDNILLTRMMKASGLHLCAKEHKYLLCTHQEEENGHRMEQRAHTSQIQFEPVHTALRTALASLPSRLEDRKKIIDFNLWPPNHERTCEGERFADEGDIKETKPG